MKNKKKKKKLKRIKWTDKHGKYIDNGHIGSARDGINWLYFEY